jgi:hypothetical protein
MHPDSAKRPRFLITITYKKHVRARSPSPTEINLLLKVLPEVIDELLSKHPELFEKKTDQSDSD